MSLGPATIQLRKEVVGALSDGLRINWRFEEAPLSSVRFSEGGFPSGPRPIGCGIRPDGVGLVQVLGCIENAHWAARPSTRPYGGNRSILGRDGLCARACAAKSDPLPSFVGAPTFCDGPDKEARVAQSRPMPRSRQSGHEGFYGWNTTPNAIEVGATKTAYRA